MADPVTAAAAASTAPTWVPAVAGAAGAIGQGIISSAFNAHQAEKNRDWQERMSSTAHQREVADLRKAGLNPILSARHGGASTPPGATAQAQTPDITSSAIQAASLRGSLELQKAQIRDINSAAALKEVQARVALRTEPEAIETIREALYKLRNESDLTAKQFQQLEQIIKNLKLEGQHSALGLSQAGAESRFYQGVGGKLAPWLERILSKLPLPSGHYKIPTGKGR